MTLCKNCEYVMQLCQWSIRYKDCPHNKKDEDKSTSQKGLNDE